MAFTTGGKQEPSLNDLGLDVPEERTREAKALGWLTTWHIQKAGRRPGG